MEAKVYSTSGKELRTVELNNEVFGREVSTGSIYYAVNNELANRRVGTACTKTRGMVNYTGAKPYRQKGTGNARAGDFKSPVRVGGGTAFGPQPRDYSYTIPKKVKKLAMKSILSLKVKEERLRIVEDFTVESGKTKDFIAILKNHAEGERALVILKDDDAMVRQAGRNIPWLKCQSFNRLSAHELFYSKKVIVLESAATELNTFYNTPKKEER